jgi:hypothetical protein
MTSPPTYRASGAVVLLNPPALPESTIEGPQIPLEWQNPYTRIGSLSVMVDIMVRVVNSEPVLAELEAAGFVGTPEIAANRDYYTGPIIDIAAESSSADAAMNDVNLLIAELDEQLVALQSEQGTAPEYFIRSDIVIRPDRATTVFSGTLRKLIVTLAACSVTVLFLGMVADRTRSRAPNAKHPLARHGEPREAPGDYGTAVGPFLEPAAVGALPQRTGSRTDTLNDAEGSPLAATVMSGVNGDRHFSVVGAETHGAAPAQAAGATVETDAPALRARRRAPKSSRRVRQMAPGKDSAPRAKADGG